MVPKDWEEKLGMFGQGGPLKLFPCVFLSQAWTLPLHKAISFWSQPYLCPHLSKFYLTDLLS